MKRARNPLLPFVVCFPSKHFTLQPKKKIEIVQLHAGLMITLFNL